MTIDEFSEFPERQNTKEKTWEKKEVIYEKNVGRMPHVEDIMGETHESSPGEDALLYRDRSRRWLTSRQREVELGRSSEM